MSEVNKIKDEINYMGRVRHWSNMEFYTDGDLPQTMDDAANVPADILAQIINNNPGIRDDR